MGHAARERGQQQHGSERASRHAQYSEEWRGEFCVNIVTVTASLPSRRATHRPDPDGPPARTAGEPTNHFALSRSSHVTRTSFPRELRLASALFLAGTATAAASCPAFLNHEFKKLHSADSVNLCSAYAGKPLLIVNTASHCGYTPQFKGLEALHRKYRDRGLVVVGFPSDDFNQEAKDQAETADVCYINYGVTFTMLAPSSVTGNNANPVFQELDRRTNEPTWNFNKYLVSADGKRVQHFDSEVAPDSPKLNTAIEQLLR
jgi:glutathione peroxidase